MHWQVAGLEVEHLECKSVLIGCSLCPLKTQFIHDWDSQSQWNTAQCSLGKLHRQPNLSVHKVIEQQFFNWRNKHTKDGLCFMLKRIERYWCFREVLGHRQQREALDKLLKVFLRSDIWTVNWRMHNTPGKWRAKGRNCEQVDHITMHFNKSNQRLQRNSEILLAMPNLFDQPQCHLSKPWEVPVHFYSLVVIWSSHTADHWQGLNEVPATLWLEVQES